MVKENHTQEVYLRQLIDACGTIEEFTTGIERNDFCGDKKTLHVCLMVLVHIWEIVATMDRYKITIPFSQHQKIIDMRNFLAHQYIDIRPSLIERTIYEDIPLLKYEILYFLR